MAKYRIEADMSFTSKTDVDAYLNHVESVKTQIFQGSGSESIAIITNCECFETDYDNSAQGATVHIDFNASAITHNSSALVKVAYRVKTDLCFDTYANAMSFANYVESIKANVYSGTGSEVEQVIRVCRYHDCKHDDPTPVRCTNYTNIDFDGAQITH